MKPEDVVTLFCEMNPEFTVDGVSPLEFRQIAHGKFGVTTEGTPVALMISTQ